MLKISSHQTLSVKTNHHPNWPYILDHSCRFLIIRVTGSGKANALLNLIKHQQRDIDHSNQSINYLSTEEKKEALKN